MMHANIGSGSPGLADGDGIANIIAIALLCADFISLLQVTKRCC
jgi:hypothetical protein